VVALPSRRRPRFEETGYSSQDEAPPRCRASSALGSKRLLLQRDEDVYVGVDSRASSGSFTASVVYARFCSGIVSKLSLQSLAKLYFQQDVQDVLIGKNYDAYTLNSGLGMDECM
jgi:hypothetical protein